MKKLYLISLATIALINFLIGPVLAANDTRPTVFMISGVAGSDFSHLGSSFEQAGLEYRFIPGQWGGTIHERIQSSFKEIQRLLGDSKRSCAIIGHSYGGVVAREMIMRNLKSRCQLFISSAAAHGGSPWANYVRGLALQAPGRLPEYLLATGLGLFFNLAQRATGPNKFLLHPLGLIFYLIRGVPQWSEGLSNWEKQFLSAMDDLNSLALAPAVQNEPQLPSEVEVVSFGLFQSRELKAENVFTRWAHQGIQNLSLALEKISGAFPAQAQASGPIYNDSIIPTAQMKLGQEFYCLESSHFSALHAFKYRGSIDVQSTLLKAYSSLVSCRLIGKKESCQRWEMAKANFLPCP